MLLCPRTRALCPKRHRGPERRQQVSVVLGLGSSPPRLQAGVAEFGIWQGRGVFVSKVEINTGIGSHAQHPLVWTEPRLQVGTVPTGHSEGRTATDPRGRLCHGPIWGPSILVFLVESGVWLRSQMVSCPGTVQRHCGGGRGGRGVQSLLLLARFCPPSGASPGTGREMLWVNVWPQ